MSYTRLWCLLPIASTEITGLVSPHIFHDLLDVPGLVLVTLRIIWFVAIFVSHVDTLLDAFGGLVVVLVCICLWVMRPYPFWQFRGSATWVQLHLVPVGVLEKFGIGETELLRTRIADEAETEVNADRLRNGLLATDL